MGDRVASEPDFGVLEGSVVDRRSLTIGGRTLALSVWELGLACCGLEVRQARRAADLVAEAALVGGSDVGGSPAADAAASGVDLNVLVVAGTVTARLAPMLLEAWAAMPEPRAVLAFGACAATGGPYWDSYSVLPGAHEVVPVHAWVAGCPPRPADLAAGLAEVLRATV